MQLVIQILVCHLGPLLDTCLLKTLYFTEVSNMAQLPDYRGEGE